MRFKSISPSKALFKNEINNEHIPALLYVKPSCTFFYYLFIYLLHSMPHYTVILHALHNLKFN